MFLKQMMLSVYEAGDQRVNPLPRLMYKCDVSQALEVFSFPKRPNKKRMLIKTVQLYPIHFQKAVKIDN